MKPDYRPLWAVLNKLDNNGADYKPDRFDKKRTAFCTLKDLKNLIIFIVVMYLACYVHKLQVAYIDRLIAEGENPDEYVEEPYPY